MSGVVVVGVDGSPSARKAAEVALGLAKSLGGSLHIVTAFDVDRSETFGVGSDEVKVWNSEAAETVAKSLGETRPGVEISYFAARGKPADALIKEAMRLDARLIVVGNRRMRGIGRLLGSVANSVAHNAPCDVYIANTYDD
ncbi:universal stress protein [Pseudarthrobacter oxydans]|jgi:nucleotide-binding universal stress UspA family protein|uniref:Nucleotide-binding universal stress UspA family protein n=1 Tax=Pseudarthrobacter oxydans TaxID=1671 RepID=A0AAW8NGK2_PSEOX|nr:universal stress protein [Pseudarthrobacter oxydans]MBA4103921.1 universal stress protein UspA [Arthrobacter sp.]MDV2981639.1 universal stress protein [Actinomycetes bacterium ARC8]WHP58752.1 universal stress protein [Arthrobacter sp. KFRI-F3372]MDR6793658.1 nucleotide-binding universal stress UspA family protein [Pseudarthrobacter oxydans]MDR7165018.1 nucleotide-binding universal stress UspA family protein [Pseudarthrobacter oxydans]